MTTQIIFEFEDSELAEAFYGWFLDCAGDQDFSRVAEMHYGKSAYAENFTRQTSAGTYAHLDMRWTPEDEE